VKSKKSRAAKASGLESSPGRRRRTREHLGRRVRSRGVMDDQGSLHGSTSVAEGRERRSLRLSNAVRIKIYKENSNRSIYFDIAKRPLRAYDRPLQQFPKDRTLASRGWRGVRVRIETSSRTAQQLGRELPSSACPRVQHFGWLLFRASTAWDGCCRGLTEAEETKGRVKVRRAFHDHQEQSLYLHFARLQSVYR